MSSIFFQISHKDFLEASKIYGGHKDFGLRIISFDNYGKLHFVYLREVTINELSILASILGLAILTNIQNTNDLLGYIFPQKYYYY